MANNKRKQGEGTMRLRSDGRWEGRVVVGYDDKGDPKTKSVTAKTKFECSSWQQKSCDNYPLQEWTVYSAPVHKHLGHLRRYP